MFSTNDKENPPSRLKIFLVFGLIIALCGSAANITNAQTNRSTYLDFTGDGKSDWAVIASPQTRDQPFRLKILGNQTGSPPSQPFIRVFDFGLAGIDVIYAADYIGDRKSDLVAYRPDQPSIFYAAQFPIGTGGIVLERAVRWGTKTDTPVLGDFDGDGKMDYTVVRATAGVGLVWFILSSSTNVMRAVYFGNSTTSFIRTISGADFTGDGRDELVVTADVNGRLVYYVGDAITGALILTRQWGFSDSFIDRSFTPSDYTGDGKADLVAVRRNTRQMVWYILDPVNNTSTATWWGLGIEAGEQSDSAVQGDYDGDGRQDIAVYRQSNRTFYVLKSSDGALIAQPWGQSGDSPLSVPYFAVYID